MHFSLKLSLKRKKQGKLKNSKNRKKGRTEDEYQKEQRDSAQGKRGGSPGFVHVPRPSQKVPHFWTQ